MEKKEKKKQNVSSVCRRTLPEHRLDRLSPKKKELLLD